MKAQIRRVDPAVVADRRAPGRSPASYADAPGWVIEEIVLAELADRPRIGGERWLGLAIAVLGALTGFGFIGRMADGDHVVRTTRPSASTLVPVASSAAISASTLEPAAADGPLALVSPAEGATLVGTTVDVVGMADRRLGTVHLTVVLGGIVLGQSDVDVVGPGRLDATIAIFAPAVLAQLELIATVDPRDEQEASRSDGLPVGIARNSLWLHPSGPVALWPARIQYSQTTTTLFVSGYAPIGVGRVRIRVVSDTGRTVGRSTAVVKLDTARAGSAGGYALGLGSFGARLSLVAHVGPGPLRIEVDWRDPISGEWGTSVLSVAADEEPSLHRK